MIFDDVGKLCVGLNRFAKLVVWHTIAVSTFKKDRKTIDEVSLDDYVLLLVQELKGQSIGKDIAKLNLEHTEVITYEPSSLSKDIAILSFGHIQLINYIGQNLVKEIAEVSL